MKHRNHHYKIIFRNKWSQGSGYEEAYICDCRNSYEAVTYAYLSRWDFESGDDPTEYLVLSQIYLWDQRVHTWNLIQDFNEFGREKF